MRCSLASDTLTYRPGTRRAVKMMSMMMISTRRIIERFRDGHGGFFCPICRIKHISVTDLGGRRRVVIGSSTLHNVWRGEAFRPDSHIDFEMIIGGCIHDLNAAFLYGFGDTTDPMDIVLACGVNNIPTDDTADSIIFQYKSFVAWIRLHSQRLCFESPSRVVIATIPYTPRHCDASDRNYEKVRAVNAWIREYNEAATGLDLRLDLRGVVGDPGREGTRVVHRYADWREPELEKKLHLSNSVKGDVARDIVNIFKKLGERST